MRKMERDKRMMNQLEADIIDELQKATKPIRGKTLEVWLHARGQEIRDAVQTLRVVFHQPIMSSRGYYLTGKIKLLKKRADSLDAQAVSMHMTAKALRQTARSIANGSLDIGRAA